MNHNSQSDNQEENQIENENQNQNFIDDQQRDEEDHIQEPVMIQPEDDEEDDDDFPEYANEQNKQLNQIIKEKRKLSRDLCKKKDETQERVKILNEHYKNVLSELLHTQQLIDAKNKEIETENHLKQITERQIGRLESEIRKSEKIGIEEQERLNDIQNQIFKGNEKLDQFKLEMNWNQEELEQWALAARQKEEDNITLEKYKRADEAKIKELNLLTERLTIEVGKKEAELEKEITETQAAQIELDKTAEEFKKHHEERHKLFLQWQEVSENIARRDKAIVEEGENFAKIKIEINNNRQALEERKRFLQKERLENKNLDGIIAANERKIVEERAQNKRIEESITNQQAEVEILKNQVSAFASDLSSKNAKIAVFIQECLNKKQRLNNAQKKYQQQEIKMKNEQLLAIEFNQSKEVAEEKFKENEKIKKDLEKEIILQKEVLFKCTEDLFTCREKEANLYGEIQGTLAACRNLSSHINKLNQEFQRQQELLYNAEYQIQLMERKVARARGERTLEEKNDLEREIKEAEQENEIIQADYKLLNASVKNINDELRAVERNLSQIVEQKKKLQSSIDELILENDMTYQDLAKIVKTKEEVLVRNDVMKLEIKKIRDHVVRAIDVVFNLENRKYQMEMSMQEREKEINVHKDVLRAEVKAAEEERHKIASELAERINKVKNYKIKYESLVQKNKASNGEVETVNEHSQAYYIIKAAQEREELQRKGDELNAKIKKSETELKALNNTLTHLKNRNSNYRDSFLNKGVSPQDYEHKNNLEEQCKAASKNLFTKQKSLQKVQKEYDEDMKRFAECSNKIEILQNQYNENLQNFEKLQNELQVQEEKKARAKAQLDAQTNNAQQLQLNLSTENPGIQQLQLDIGGNKLKTLLNAVYMLSTEFPEMSNSLNQCLEQRNIKVPSRPQSSIDTKSIKSISSQNSRK